jgi:hypothetical protein
VIDDVTGRIVTSEDEAVAALGEVLSLDRAAVRRRFDERFTASRMARDYVKIYRMLSRRLSDREVDSGVPLQVEHRDDHGLRAHVE